jgi:release factor glutamine methyltransferase
MYEPREDSFLIKRHIKEFCKSKSTILDIGTGSGILAIEGSKHVKQVIAVDIDPKTISQIRKLHLPKNIKILQSNLFSRIKKQKFDLIVFNPPYIPTEKIKYTDLDGGKNGTEVIEPFLKDAKQFLKPSGKILLLTSSLTKDIESLFKEYKYSYKMIDKEKFAFEELYLWILE